jgi:acyl-CoA thioester hydrolase
MPQPIDPVAARSVVRLRVRFGETDLMGIVHHGSYVAYLEVARVEWLRRRGVTYAEWAQRGLHTAVVDLSLRYRAPARFDDEIDVETVLTEWRAATIAFDYRVVRVADGELLAEGSTRLACVDDKGALRRLHDEMVDVMARGEAPA